MVEKWLYQVSFLEDSLLKWVTYFDYISKEVLSSSGHFITTSNYSKAAKDYASSIDSKIILIDGETLAQMLIDFDLGVSPVAMYSLKRIDLDYFTE